MAYRARRAREALPLPSTGPLLKRFLGKLPFRLTRAQGRAMAEILRDLAQPHPMQRLLQGDVGSGKTIVAAIGCLAAIDAGCQAAVMAPTEILAEQHLRKFTEWLAPLGVPIAWLHGGLSAAEKNAVVEAAAGAGAADRHRHARAVPEEGGLRAPRARGRGRAAPLRRAAAARAAKERRSRRQPVPAPADDERDADSAHAVDDLLRRPGRLDHRRAAAGAPRRRDAPGRRRPARGGAGAHPRGLRRGPAGLLGLPGDRGVQGRRPADRARYLRHAAQGTEGPARRPAARPPAGGGESRRR